MAKEVHSGELLNLLTETQATMSRLFSHRARDLGLTPPQWRVLGRVYRRNGMTQAELSELTGIAPSPLGKVVDQLEASGFVERRNDPHDRRVNRVYATEAVQPIIGPAHELAKELERAAMQGLPRNGALVEQLTRLRASLGELAAQEFTAEAS